MTNDGSQLEALVAFVERTLVPQGFDVKTNRRVFNDEGIQVAEFDVEVRGKVGTTSIAWLIECRDRPGTGRAPGSWIEQLVGRRSRFGFNKVTAVSTTGFVEDAVEFARDQGMELREVASLSPEAFSSWLQMSQMVQRIHCPNLERARVLLRPDASEDVKAAVLDVIKGAADSNVLRSTKTGQLISFGSAFAGAVQSQNLFDGIAPNSGSRPVRLQVLYLNDYDCFEIDTQLGPVRVESIYFDGNLTVTENIIPISVTSEYRNLGTGGVISQVAAFEPEISGKRLSLELHHIGDTGETHVIVRQQECDD